MKDDYALIQWLDSLSHDKPVEIDGEFVYLKTAESGAELSAYLIHSYKPLELHAALCLVFSNTVNTQHIETTSSVGIAANGKDLLLSKWLPSVTSWLEAAEPLEALLNELPEWRERITQAVSLH